MTVLRRNAESLTLSDLTALISELAAKNASPIAVLVEVLVATNKALVEEVEALCEEIARLLRV